MCGQAAGTSGVEPLSAGDPPGGSRRRAPAPAPGRAGTGGAFQAAGVVAVLQRVAASLVMGMPHSPQKSCRAVRVLNWYCRSLSAPCMMRMPASSTEATMAPLRRQMAQSQRRGSMPSGRCSSSTTALQWQLAVWYSRMGVLPTRLIMVACGMSGIGLMVAGLGRAATGRWAWRLLAAWCCGHRAMCRCDRDVRCGQRLLLVVRNALGDALVWYLPGGVSLARQQQKPGTRPGGFTASGDRSRGRPGRSRRRRLPPARPSAMAARFPARPSASTAG